MIIVFFLSAKDVIGFTKRFYEARVIGVAILDKNYTMQLEAFCFLAARHDGVRESSASTAVPVLTQWHLVEQDGIHGDDGSSNQPCTTNILQPTLKRKRTWFNCIIAVADLGEGLDCPSPLFWKKKGRKEEKPAGQAIFANQHRFNIAVELVAEKSASGFFLAYPCNPWASDSLTVLTERNYLLIRTI